MTPKPFYEPCEPREIVGDLFQQRDDIDAIVITTNCVVRWNGLAVMGRGVARQAQERWSEAPRLLGQHLIQNGNVPTELVVGAIWYRVFTLPTKNNWRDRSDLGLIKRSLERLLPLVSGLRVAMPRPGCANGGLDWKEVKPAIWPLLALGNFVIINKEV